MKMDILCITAHPDDIELGAGGHKKKGRSRIANFRCIYISDFEKTIGIQKRQKQPEAALSL